MNKSSDVDKFNEARRRHLVSGWSEIPRVAICVYTYWKGSYICKAREEVDAGITELYITTGYREENQPWMYYLKSIFFPNNQAINVWTHFIPFLCFLYRYYRFIDQANDPFDLINFPYYIHGLGVCCALLTSSAAHTFCSRSTSVARACFGGDFAAIYQYGISFAVAADSYICPIQIHCGGPSTLRYATYAVVSCTAAAFTTLYVNTFKRGISPYIRSTFYVVAMSIAYSPCVVKFSLGRGDHPTSDHPTSFVSSGHMALFYFQLACLTLSCVFYVVRFPEVRYYGRFDILGHSHHWFHLLTALSMYTQSLLLEGALLELKKALKSGLFRMDDLEISWESTFGVFLVSLLFLGWVVAIYAYVMCRPKKPKTS